MIEVECLIKEVEATMAMEDFEITEEDKNRMRYCAYDNEKVEEVIASLVEKHTVKEVF